MGIISIPLHTAPLTILSCLLGNAIAPFTTYLHAAQIGALGNAFLWFIAPIPATILVVWADMTGRFPKGDIEGLTLKKRGFVVLLFGLAYFYVVTAPSFLGVVVFNYLVERLDDSLYYKVPYAAVLGAWDLVGIFVLAMAPVAVYVVASDKEPVFKFGNVPQKAEAVAEGQKKN